MVIGVIAVALVAAGGGYWWGKAASPEAGSGLAAPDAARATGNPEQRQLLYYRNPMGLPDTSPVPKKDPMGMDYIPVYAGDPDDEAAAPDQITISTAKVQKLGVRTEAAQLRTLERTVRAAGRVEPDERRLFTIAAKFEGYVERVYVNVTGQPVGKGQALFEVYSLELVSAQREYAIAAEGVEALKDAGGQARAGMQQLADASLQRLKNWDISDEQIRALAKSGDAKRTLTFRSPVAGVVTDKKAVQGMRFLPGETLFQIADTSAVWVLADVFEQDIGAVHTGQKADIRINAYPGEVFAGRIAYVYPTLKAETRTVPVRIELPNPKGKLKPAMFADVDIPASGGQPVLTVPASAVIDSGARQTVVVQLAEGRFEPRAVRLGQRGGEYVQILDGVREGEMVVSSANFLIDAESNLKAALGGFGPAVPANAVGQKRVSHTAQGKVTDVDAKAGTVSLEHGPVESLKWPSMTMEFKLANEALLKDLKPGARIDFEFVERGQGEWVITRVTTNSH